MSKSHTEVTVLVLPKCDFCKQNGIDRDAVYDAKVSIATSWANMCQGHYGLYGIGLGLGKGQKLVLADQAPLELQHSITDAADWLNGKHDQ